MVFYFFKNYSNSLKKKISPINFNNILICYNRYSLKCINKILLKSGFKLQERQKWCPHWQLPNSSFVGEDGYLYTWYLDGVDD